MAERKLEIPDTPERANALFEEYIEGCKSGETETATTARHGLQYLLNEVPVNFSEPLEIRLALASITCPEGLNNATSLATQEDGEAIFTINPEDITGVNNSGSKWILWVNWTNETFVIFHEEGEEKSAAVVPLAEGLESIRLILDSED